jgi:hypothetical protein
VQERRETTADHVGPMSSVKILLSKS